MSLRSLPLFLALVACAPQAAVDPRLYEGDGTGGDAGSGSDGGRTDAGRKNDAGSADAGRQDGGGSEDAGEGDGGSTDAGSSDCVPACSAGSRCVNGQCVLITCSPPEEKCGGACIDTSSDPLHCGSCTRACPQTGTGEPMCVNGACGNHCPSDPEGVACPSPNTCSAGHCCASGQTWCTDHCTTLSVDQQNCGRCGNVCIAPDHGTATCMSGNCQRSCSSGYTPCGSSCADLQNDVSNCGTCGRGCSSNACSNGTCVVAFATCSISSSTGWQTCGNLSVTQGDTLTFSAAGHWVWAPTWDSPGCDAPGESSNPVPLVDYRYWTSSNYGALLWGVDNSNDSGDFDSASWDSGRSAWIVQTTATASGQILFRINDQDSKYYDNTGSMNVRVDVSR